VVNINEQFNEGEYLARIALIIVALEHHLNHYADELTDIDTLLVVVVKRLADVHEVTGRQTADKLVL
jgi:hypothetical protein